jgi:hypothetical protein
VDRRSRLRTTTLQNRNEPLKNIPLYSDKEKNLTVIYSLPFNIICRSVTPVPERIPVLHYNLRGYSHLL